mmetsp:Transcript_10445/g.42618  ORF Transcript_10445/g.42618 Transcript_10445/m.42618 type:complete len:696 (-) Transcript_10445:2300-4387(-)
MAGQPEEGLEDAFAHVRRHAGAAVGDDEFIAARHRAQRQLHLGATVAARVVQQVAQRTAQQAVLSDDAGRVGLGLEGHPGPCGLLGAQGQQVDALAVAHRAAGLQPAGQQHLFHQGVQLGDVGIDLVGQALALGLAGTVEHREGHLQTGQRRAQLMAGIGEQALVRAQQALDTVGRLVEAGGQRRHFVAAAVFDTVAELAGAELLHALLERFQPPREPPHHRIGASRHAHKQQHQHHRQGRHDRRARGPRPGQPGAGPGVFLGPGRPRTQPRACTRATRGGQRPHAAHQGQAAAVAQAGADDQRAGVGGPALEHRRRGDAAAVGRIQRQRHAQPAAPLGKGLGLLAERRRRRRQRELEQPGHRIESIAGRRLDLAPLLLDMAVEQPGRAEGEGQQHRDQRQVDADVEGLQTGASGRVGILLAGKDIAGAAHGQHAARALGVVLDDGPDARDVHIDGAVEGLERMALERVHDLVAGKHPAGALREHHQQIELVAGQIADLAVQARDAGGQIDLEPAEAQHLVAIEFGFEPAQQGLDAGLQLARLEGLGEVVVGTQFQAEDAIHGLAARRQHQHRLMAPARVAAQPAAEVQAVAVGQHQVQHDQFEAALGQCLAGLGQAAGRVDLEAGGLEVVTHHAGQAGVVVNQQESGATHHRNKGRGRGPARLGAGGLRLKHRRTPDGEGIRRHGGRPCGPRAS